MSLIPITPQSPIPPDLKEKLSTPQTPWAISKALFNRITEQSTPTHQRFKKCSLVSSDPEHAFVLRYFLEHKPVGYSISNVHCIHNRAHTQAFEAELTNMESEAKHFLPRWSEEPHHDQRGEAIQRWQSCVNSFTPLEVSTAEGKETILTAKVLPLWHGSNDEKCASIATSGFAYFGKHAYFDSKTQFSKTTSTDIGFFGSGIYFTNSAQYAALYAKGHLLLSWVSMREPYPVIADLLFPSKPTDMKMLEGKGAYQNYNAHYIPVVSIDPNNPKCMIYYPTCVDQLAAWDEIVVFQKSQTLPKFWIELAPDGPLTLPMVYDFSHGYAVCQTGDLEQLKVWIKEDPSRLTERNDQGETLAYPALNQPHILKWLLTQEPPLLKICREDGQTLMHIAAAEGHIDSLRWLHTQDPQLIQQTNHQKWTPLHLAAFNEQLNVLSLFIAEAKELILLITEKPCPQTLEFLLTQGISPHTANPFQQTLLHLAAQAGQGPNVLCLLEHGAHPNAQDLSKRTPLFLAVLQNHRTIAQILLPQTDVTLTSIEQETLLHAAAFYGYAPLLQELLDTPSCKRLIEARDHDGKTPLHKAVWMDPKPDVVELLIAHRANPKALNAYDYTPLHWAAKHGHLKSVQILMGQKINVHALNKNGHTPIDMAIHFGQDEVIHLFLGTTRRLQIEPPSKDLEGYYYKCLKEAKQQNLLEEQIFFLEKLSDLYIEKKDFVTGAKILNSALALLKNNPLFEQHLLAKLERIEGFFLESHGIKTDASRRRYLTVYRSWMRDSRKWCTAAFTNKEPIQNILADLTNEAKKLLKTLIREAQKSLGPPPVQWACIAMGSMSRNEMCPYSDIEFAFLIKKETPEALAYFRLLSQLLELQIINLGETEFLIFGDREPSFTLDGFCMDTGGNTPLGMPGVYEFISTPQQLACFQTLEWIDKAIILANAANCVCWIAGDEKLIDAYERKKAIVLKLKQKAFEKKESREILAMRLLAGHLGEFAPNLSQNKEKDTAFGIKKELYRPFQEILSSLALFYDLKARNTFERIDELIERGVFSVQGAENLKQALRQVLALRLEAHLFYQDKKEFLCHPEEGKPQEPQLLYINQAHIESLHEIYKVLIPFHKSIKEFFTTKKKQTLNQQLFYGDSPIDLAMRYGQDAVIHLFLGTTRRLKTEPPTPDLEGYYYKCLKEAKQQNLLEEQIFFLEKLSDVYIEKKQFVTGAKLLNSALALLKNNPLFEQHLLTKLERIEGLFLESNSIKTDVSRRGYLTVYRSWMRDSRKWCTAAFTNKEPIQEILADLTTEAKKLLKTLITEAQKSLGPPPVQWACIGMGSMSRNEMCPYSDIEFAFLIKKETPEALAYFRLLSQLLAFQIINLGETKFPVFGEREPSPTPDGFCMDTGGNTPLGMPGVYELIGTPQQLARFQTLEWIDQNIILANALNCVCWIAGEEKLIDVYGDKKATVLKLKQKAFEKKESREILAMRLLVGHLGEFAPNLSQDKEQDNAFGIKKELYRPLQEILSSLALFYDLKAKNTFERIDELVEKEVFSVRGAENLKQALRQVLTLRLEAHLFYQDEKEFLCHPEERKPQEPQLLYINQAHIESLHEIYKVLIPFHKSIKEFFTTKKKQTLNQQLFYDEGPAVRAVALEKTLQYKEAQAAYQQAVSLNPNDINALLRLGSMEGKLGNAQEALKRAEKALVQARKVYGEEHSDVALSYHSIGLALDSQGKYDEALVYSQKALMILIKVLGEGHPDVASSYNNIGSALNSQGKYDEALVYLQKALTIRIKVLDEGHPDVATSYNNIGVALHAQGKYDEALVYYRKALTVLIKVLGEEHPNVATNYNNIGAILDSQGKYDEALVYYQKALTIQLKVLGEGHPTVATSYNNIGFTLKAQGKYDEALGYYQKALTIKLKVLGEGHPNVIGVYKSIAVVLEHLGDHKQALEYQRKAQQI